MFIMANYDPYGHDDLEACWAVKDTPGVTATKVNISVFCWMNAAKYAGFMATPKADRCSAIRAQLIVLTGDDRTEYVTRLGGGENALALAEEFARRDAFFANATDA